MARSFHRAEDVASFKGMGRAIKEVRDRYGLTQAETARRAELSTSTLSAIEKGKSNAGWASLRRISYALDFPLEALLEKAEELAPGPGGRKWRWLNQEQRRRLGEAGE
jgi:transcriptional regulator with XRE-family HTH domain